ncbi:a6a7ad3c-3924-44e0-b0a0-12f5ebc685c1 [Sclerotinia trifoliorum]|uniref:A6a7ad3c-3924-44e0-b0a0-12f5ebc685c1 n=1 Tax=Sclerotinia trifoliorum TaxID=28548 RepID=A0A8H2VYK1_9HELO|nr:a6a7ad3c-3924-44e0-b0a0-12f5ebc685c1 [Sclerotinia trifoliorum]
MQIKGSFLLVLGVSIQWVFAAPRDIRVQERDDSAALSSTISSTSPSISSSAKGPRKSNESPTSASTTTHSRSTSSSMPTSVSMSATPSTSSTMLTSAASSSSISGSATTIPVTDSAFNSTIPPGQLPLRPEITPAFAIAGVILVTTGALSTLIGVKNRWLHISLSTAYLASLAITVLILYVMNLPVSNAVQGAYVVAVVLPGLIIGGCSLIFSEMAEGLGCLLGGFCFSMWLLVMKTGGLITSTSGKSVLIAVISIGAYSLSFSNYTRTYGLIACISFAGSTAIVLGIDCFSRAGLKEFWAYIWNLNQNLFPLGATTYPVTRGIRVEIAAVFIIFLAGLVSQSKVHKMIQDRRAQRIEERQENARVLEEEEMNIGKRIEDRNIAEKEQWEKTYGDNIKIKSVDESTRDSGVSDMERPTLSPASTITSIMELDGKEIEMSDIFSPTRSNGTGLVMPDRKGHDGAVTVRVARDVEPESDHSTPSPQLNQASNASQTITILASDEGSAVEIDEKSRQATRTSQKLQNGTSTSEITVAPEVVPLPFKIPEDEVEDNRSSIATSPDEDSNGCALLEELTTRSKRESQGDSKEQGVNAHEDLVIPYANEDDRASSVAATMDDLSDDEDREARSVRSSFVDQKVAMPDAEIPAAETQQNEQSLVLQTETTIEPPADAPGQTLSLTLTEPTPEDGLNKVATEKPGIVLNSEFRPESGITVATDILNVPGGQTFLEDSLPQRKHVTASEDLTAITIDREDAENFEANEDATESKFKTEPSVTSAPDTKTATLTKDRLPSQLSRVVMSYRTNEWAKHLSHADSPQLEDLNISENILEEHKSEPAVPVDIEALQQTAHDALPPPAPHSSSQQSTSPGLTRSSSTQSNITPFATIHEHDISTRNSSQQSLGGYASQRLPRNSPNPNIPELIVESPGKGTRTSQKHPSQMISPPFGGSNTLMGKRDTMLRNRSSYFPAINCPTRSMTSPGQYQLSPSASPSQMDDETGSIRNSLGYHHLGTSSPILPEDDDIPLSHRRELIRQSTSQPLITPKTTFNSHQPKRKSAIPSPMVREQQLASWRQSIANDVQVQKKGLRRKNIESRKEG